MKSDLVVLHKGELRGELLLERKQMSEVQRIKCIKNEIKSIWEDL
jgi:hypothetical protein